MKKGRGVDLHVLFLIHDHRPNPLQKLPDDPGQSIIRVIKIPEGIRLIIRRGEVHEYVFVASG